MEVLISREINQIRKDVKKMAGLSDDYIFSFVCFKYYYNGGELNATDYTNTFTDGKNDGGIDLVSVVDETINQPTLLIIQSKNQSVLNSPSDILDILHKMDRTLKDFENKNTANYNTRLKRILKNKLSDVEDTSYETNLVIFHNSEVTEDKRAKIDELIEKEENLRNYSINIFFRNDIEQQIKSVLEPKRFVEESKIVIAKKDGLIKYGENGLLVNISAQSLRDLYDKFKDNGLFEQNFRYYIKHKRIDENILESLKKKKNEFWFLNNGIIIGCYNFKVDGDNVKLEKFSIINGCQTATLIGQYKEKGGAFEDFFIPCKIVKPKNDVSDDKFEKFISEIAESSNSQKPIADRDLKSNKPEQRNLQRLLKEEDPKIFLEIKRGEEKKRTNEKWQQISNEAYGQLILSFNLLQPGTARSGKKKIFAEEALYKKVFLRRIDKDNIIDLLKLNEYYKEWLENKTKNDEFNKTEYQLVASNGRLAVLASIAFFIKYKRGLINIKQSSDKHSYDQWSSEFQKDVISGKIFINSLPDDFKNLLDEFFLEIVQSISDVYESKQDEYKSVSNFLKLDGYFGKDILIYFINKIIDKPTRAKQYNEYLNLFA